MNYSSTPTLLDDRPTPVEDFVPAQDGGAQQGPALLEYWRMVLRWRWVILGIVVLSVALGLIFTLMMTPQYTASTRLEISREQKRVTNIKDVNADADRLDQEFYQTQYTLLSARSIAERVARELKLGEDPKFFEAHAVEFEGMYDKKVLTAAQREKRMKMAAGVMLGHVSVSPIQRSSLVDVRYTSASPELSARIANAWAQQFIADTIDRRFASSSDARVFLERRLAELREKLQQSERDLVNYATQNNIVALTKTEQQGRTLVQRTLVADELESLNEAMAQAISERIAAESRTGGGGLATDMANTSLSTLRQRRAEAGAEYARLMVQYEAGHPTARAVKEQMTALDTAIASEQARTRGGLGNDYRSAVQRETALRERVKALTSQLNNQQQASIQYNIYQREV
ncbi:MAG: hypothetical protein EOP61_24055, partial [Sphingomonadales bacterium]